MKNNTQKITPNLWFNGNAKEAVDFYVSAFPDASVIFTSHYPKSKDDGLADFQINMAGKILTIDFEIMGFRFVTINAGPEFTPNPSISFSLNLETKEEVRMIWDKLLAGSKVLMPLQKYPFSEYYGWLNDKFGVSWQLIALGDQAKVRPKITPALMFTQEKAGQAKEAINFYTQIFKDGKIGGIYLYSSNQAPDKEGTIAHSEFFLEGQEFMALDSAQRHDFTFNEGVSLLISCKDQEEIDYYWEKLTSDGGEECVCGWLKDRYGVSWQVTPANMESLMKKPDAFKIMMKQKKIIIAEYEQCL